ncbi:ATP-dependent DNA helicase [Methylobacterium komagatae]
MDYVTHSPSFVGIGRTTARLIWDHLGVELFSLLSRGDSAQLSAAVPGLGTEKATALIDAWRASGQERLIEWLDERQLPRRLSNVLLKAYADQDEAVSRLTADPYRLLAFGLSWKEVDKIARNAFAVAEQDLRRLHAAAVAVLMGEYDQGHTAASAAKLTEGIKRLLTVDEEAAAQALRLAFADGGFVRTGHDLFQLRGVHVMERSIAADLARRCTSAAQVRLDLDCESAIDDYERCGKSCIRLTDRQRQAVRNGLEMPLSAVVGGAGTGKTACLEALHHAIERMSGRKNAVLQMALAGRAAKRMREATGRDAVTIAGFLHTVDEERIAQISHLVIDEASMLDVPGFYAVLRRLRGRANIVLVGDEFQLPPVGSGKILHLLARRNGVPATILDRVWRQEEGNSIRTVATAIRSGIVPEIPLFFGPADGVSIIHPGDDLTAKVRELFEMLGGLEQQSDLRVMTPRRRTGSDSALAINTAIHRAHFADGEHVVEEDDDTGFCVGDRFVCDVNHWDVDLMNGSLGRILRCATADEIEAASREKAEGVKPERGLPAALVEIDGKERLLERRHLLDCSWGYALTCHRAQGSDFGRVIVVLNGKVDRSWLYTAVTRGRQQIVLVGTPEQVRQIVATVPRVDERQVGLEALLSRFLASSREALHG